MAKTKVYTMNKHNPCVTELKEWQDLVRHQTSIANDHMRDWFRTDIDRFSQYSLQFGEILFDFSRNRINQTTCQLLDRLAHAAQLPEKITRLCSGQPINTTEKRAVLHTALRDKRHPPLWVNGENVTSLINDALDRMSVFCDQVHTQTWRGSTGKPIHHIVTLGVGGSYLGTMMCCHALKDFAVNDLSFHFISSIDKSLMNDVLAQIDPEATLFIISSKTFTTLETMTNANTLLDQLRHTLGNEALRHHFIAITANEQKAIELGLAPHNIFPLWDWVGGRYSIWSAIGLPLMLMIGRDAFQQFLDGAHQVDLHFQQADFSRNIPVLMGMLSIWYRNFFHASAQAIIPYAHRLRHLVPYLQQADMESNGKRIRSSGDETTYATGPIIFGDEGCNGQHSYHQLLHQGQHLVPVDFILIGKPTNATHDHHQDMLIASGLSQAQALMLGKTWQEARQHLLKKGYSNEEAGMLAKHQTNPGNRPSNVLFLERLTPYNLGALLALYEHKIFVQGAIWDINSFDQWGVELGKELLPAILQGIQNTQALRETDSATTGLIHHFKKCQDNA